MRNKKELLFGIVVRIFGGILIGFLLIYIEFRIWRDYTNLDVLHLVGFHFLVGNWIMLGVINVGVESARKFAKKWRTRQSILKKYKRG